MGAAAGYWWQWNIAVCIYTMMYLSPRKLHPVFHLKGGICVQKKDAQFPRVST